MKSKESIFKKATSGEDAAITERQYHKILFMKDKLERTDIKKLDPAAQKIAVELKEILNSLLKRPIIGRR